MERRKTCRRVVVWLLVVSAARCHQSFSGFAVLHTGSCNHLRRAHPAVSKIALRSLSSDLEVGLGIVEPFAKRLLRSERDTLMSLLRMLPTPLHADWVPIAVLIFLACGGLRYASVAVHWFRQLVLVQPRHLDTTKEVDSVISSVKPGNVLRDRVLRRGFTDLVPESTIVWPRYWGPVVEFHGFHDSRLNTKFKLSAEPCGEVFRSFNGKYVLSSWETGTRRTWAILHLERYELLRSGERLNVREAFLAESPRDADLSPSETGWWEHSVDGWLLRSGAGPVMYQSQTAPVVAWMLPPNSPQLLPYERTYAQAAQVPILVWSLSILFLQLAERSRLIAVLQRVIPITHVLPRLRWLIASTAAVLFCNALTAKWRTRRSRGKAENSDVLGLASSQREARLTALTMALRVAMWTLWVVWVMAIFGINVGRVLLIPSLGALVLGFVGRDILSNMLNGLMLHLAMPFAQGDWITLEQGQDGWVNAIGLFYTKITQWDKRPLYVPNSRLIQMLVQNNSRMTNRRIKFDINVRLQDIPKIPAIVTDLQSMLVEHEQVDDVQHRLVRWRSLGDYYATIWLSCYTKSSTQGIRLKHYIAVEQSVLERTAAIVYRHGADFACSTERVRRPINDQLVTDREGKFPWTAPDDNKTVREELRQAEEVSKERTLHDSREKALEQQEKRLTKLSTELEERAEQQGAHKKSEEAQLAGEGDDNGGEPHLEPPPHSLDKLTRIPVKDMGD